MRAWQDHPGAWLGVVIESARAFAARAAGESDGQARVNLDLAGTER